jgi:hypothetical protein
MSLKGRSMTRSLDKENENWFWHCLSAVYKLIGTLYI